MFWASDDLLRLLSHLDINYVGFATFLVNDTHPPMVTSVRHSFMDGGFDQDSYLLAGLIDPQNSA
jgi:predicted branched-subunit amino acid permease